MGLKNFLKQRGFIEDSDKKTGADTAPGVIPAFFPVSASTDEQTKKTAVDTVADPSFVTPLIHSSLQKDELDPSFVKFFEDELVKANMPGPDYFEFRQLLTKTQQRMAAKGNSAPEVVLQAVLMSFEAQDISPAKLCEAAKQYKQILKQKNDDFLKGAATEKNNQLQKRENVLQQHNDNIEKIKDQLQQLELQKQTLEQALNKENTQQEVDKTLGKEGIEKIEKAERLISLAHNYIQSTSDNDIKRLQSV